MKRFLAACAVAAALPASAETVGPFSDIVYFGDSLTDSGNAAALAASLDLEFNFEDYPLGQFTNGNVWATQLGATPSLLGGTNFAYGGARAIDNGDPIPDLSAQVNQYLALQPSLGPDPLAAIWIGGNDFRDFAAAGAVDQAAVTAFVGGLVAEISTAVTTIASTGIADIVVFGLPDIGQLPNFVGTGIGAAVSQVVTGYNAALQGTILSLDAWLAGANVSYFDSQSLFERILGPDNAFGFTNWTQSCLDNFADCEGNQDTWVFWDSIHPTEAVHSIVAEAFADQVAPIPLPAGFPLLLAGLGALVVMSRRRKSLA